MIGIYHTTIVEETIIYRRMVVDDQWISTVQSVKHASSPSKERVNVPAVDLRRCTAQTEQQWRIQTDAY